MKIFKKLFFPIIFLLLTSCSNNFTEIKETGKGALYITVDDLDISVDDSLLSKAHTPPGASLFTVKISNGENVIYNSTTPTESLTVDVGTYNIEAIYGSEKKLSINAPYYYASQNVIVQVGSVHSVKLEPTLKCALVEVVVPEDLVAQFSSYEVKVICTEESVSISNNDVVYVKAGEDISVTLSGVNSLGEQKSFTLASYTKVEALKKYIINCKIPELSLPEQDISKTWSMSATLYPTTSSNISGGNVDNIASRVVHEYSIDGTNWTTVTPVDGKIELANLTHNTTYHYRSKYGNIICSNPYTFKTEEKIALPYGDMETWGSGGATNLVFLGPTNNSYWGVRNTQTTSEGINAWQVKGSGTYSDGDAVSGQAAKLTTIGWGAGSTWAGFMWSAVIKKFAGAWLLVGSVDTDGTITKGRPHTSRPTNLQFSYKYAPKNGSGWKVEAEILSGDKIIGTASFADNGSVGSYTTKNMAITYSDETLKATDIYIFFTDNTKTSLGKDDISKMSGDNKFEGAVLKLDNIELVYNK